MWQSCKKEKQTSITHSHSGWFNRCNVDNNGAKNIINRLNQIPYRGGTNLVAAMNLARNHFAQGKVANWNLDCSQNYLIVISDGYWGSNSSVTSIAKQLNKSLNVKTFTLLSLKKLLSI